MSVPRTKKANLTECPHEQDMIDAIQSARWPARAEATLLAHVTDCEVCRDVAMVATLVMAEAHDPTSIGADAVHVPDARAVWLRAQWRARAEAERRVTHPITAAQAAAIACVAGLGGALVGATSASVQAWLAAVSANVGAAIPALVVPNGLVSVVVSHAMAAIGIGLAVVLAPAVAFLATRE